MDSRILVKDYMKPLTLSFRADTAVEEVTRQLVEHRASGAPVLGEQRQLLGFVTQQDCIREMLNDSYYCQDHAVAEGIMSNEVLSVSPEDDILSLAQMIIDRKPKAYPVVDQGRVIGLIGRTDVLRGLSQYRKNACRVN